MVGLVIYTKEVQGFTLIEVLVTITIVSIMSAVLVVSWPRARDHNALVITERQLQSLLRDAQEKALNGDRAPTCVASTPEARRCADIGIALHNNQVILFADTKGTNNSYTPGNSGDAILLNTTLPSGVTSVNTNWQSYLFRFVPPIVELYGNGQLVSQNGASLTVQIRQQQKQWRVLPYGQLQPQ